MSCRDCVKILANPATTISELFAVLRQWDTATQNGIDRIVAEMFKRDLKVNDRDSITGQTVLHFACKSGARGVGDEKVGEKVITDLLRRGADANAVSMWTNMTPAHVAAYFGCDLALAALCTAGANLKAACAEFDNATPLHLAAMAGSLPAVKTLLRFRADPLARDRLHRTPANAAKLVLSSGVDTGAQELTDVINHLVDVEEKQPPLEGGRATDPPPVSTSRGLPGGISAGRAGASASASLSKSTGSASGGSGTPAKKSTGPAAAATTSSTSRSVSILGTAASNSSATAPTTPSRIPSSSTAAAGGATRGAATPRTPSSTTRAIAAPSALPRPTISPGGTTTTNPPRTPLSSAGARGSSGGSSGSGAAGTPSGLRTPSGIARLTNPTAKSSTPRGGGPRADPTPKLPLGSRVLVGMKHGVVRFIGETNLGEGLFIGVELDEPEGKHDGSVDGVRYFIAEEGHGVFVRPRGCTFRGVDCATLFA